MSDQICSTAKNPIELSWTRLKNWKACHKRSSLLISGHNEKIKDVRGFLPGKIADLAMRQWLEAGEYNKEALVPGGMARLIPDIFLNMTSKSAEGVIKWKGDPAKDQEKVILTALEAVNKLEPVLFEKVVPYNYKPEYRVKAPVTIPDLDGNKITVLLTLAADVAVQRELGWYGLYDLKVTRGGTYMESTLGQLVFYDIAFKAYTGLTVKEHEFWAPLLPEPVWALNVTDDDRSKMISDIIEYFHSNWRGDDDMVENDRECYFCPVKHACPRFVQEITKDQQGKNRVSFSRGK